MSFSPRWAIPVLRIVQYLLASPFWAEERRFPFIGTTHGFEQMR